MPHPPKRRLVCLALAVLTMLVGLVWRMVPLGLPPFLFKYGGSVLWAAMVYWLLAVILPKWSPIRIAMLAGVVALGVEFFRLIHTPALDAFRPTLAGRLLLGRFFSWRDIVAYWLAIALTAAFDSNAAHKRWLGNA